MEHLEIRAAIVSASPGRVRLRLPRSSRGPRLVQRVRDGLANRPGIERVDANESTGSVVVHFDQQAISPDGLLELIHDAGVVIEELNPFDVTEVFRARTRSTVATRISTTADHFDRQLALATGQKVDLRLLFPLGLFAFAVRQIAVAGLGLNQVPGYVLLWYAFDSFWKLHRELPNGPTAPVEAAPTTPAGGAPESTGG